MPWDCKFNHKVERWGGGVDWDDPTVIPNGVAVTCRNSRFRAESVATRFGLTHSMIAASLPSPAGVTGLDCLNVLINNPQQIPVIFTDQGQMLRETPSGSGTLVPITPPVVLPTAAYMQDAMADNRMCIALSDMKKGLLPPLMLDGPSGVLSVAGQNATGALWQPGVYYELGDVIRSTDGRWWRCTVANSLISGPLPPAFPQYNGYFTGASPAINISTASLHHSGNVLSQANQVMLVSSTSGVNLGDTIVVKNVTSGAGTPAGFFNGTVVVAAINPGISITVLRTVFGFLNYSGTGGTIVDTTGPGSSGGGSVYAPAQVTDSISQTTWQEWTPTCVQYLPAPDVSNMTITDQPGFGTIPAGKDVYVKLTYWVDSGSVGLYYGYESPRSVALKFTNTQANDLLTVAHTGDLTGGVTMPQWLAQLFQNSQFIIPTLNIYVAAVTTGAAAPADSAYFNLGFSAVAATAPASVASIPVANAATWTPGAPVLFFPYLASTLAISGEVFIGEGGTRYMIVLRTNRNGSISPVDVGSPIPINLVGEVEVQIINIERDGSGNVTATVGDVTGFASGQTIRVQGCTGDATFNSPIAGFSLSSVQTTLNPQGVLKWLDSAHLSASNDNTGAVILPPGPSPVIFLPPGGPNDLQDMAAFTVAASQSGQPNNLQAGPFNSIPQADPSKVVSTPITTMSGPLTLSFTGVTLTRDASGNVTVPITNIQGIVPGAFIAVAKGSDVSLDGDFVLNAVTPGTGTAGVLSWQQPAGAATSGTANLTVGLEQLGQAQAVLQNPAGFSAGSIVSIYAASPNAFNGVVTLASVLGSVATFPSAAVGSAITPGIMTLLQELPTVSNAVPTPITSITRDAFGNVTAFVPALYGWSTGQAATVVDVDNATFNGVFELTSATVNNDLVTATLRWQQQLGTFAGPAVATSENGTMSASSIFAANFDSEALAAADDVTAQLTAAPPPLSTDVFFSETLNRMVYTRGDDTSHYFSNIGDNENIDQAGGILPVAENNGAVTVCFREMTNGEQLSLKANGGYAIPQDLNSPDNWEPLRRWDTIGPANAKCAALGTDFLIVFSEPSGPYRYDGRNLEWVGMEKQGTWDRVNWGAKPVMWCEVNEDNQEVYFGLPLDGATFVNKVVTLNYFNGWQKPLTENLRGDVIPNRSGRRWSEDDIQAASGKLVIRTLSPGVDVRINNRQMLFGMGVGFATGVNSAFVDFKQPDKYVDDGPTQQSGAYVQNGIDWEYQPAFAQSPTFEIFRWAKFKGRYLGSGQINFQPVTEDPNFTAEPLVSQSSVSNDEEGNPTIVPTKFCFGMVVEGDNEMVTLNINNGAVPGAWAEMHGLVIGGNEIHDSQETQ